MEENFSPTFGKTVLETLTTAMYDDKRYIFREYIQNAADQIDVAVEEGILNVKSEGKIDIKIDETIKKITISDNATGISQKDVLGFLGDVANSQKDGIARKGFRGIGRLGGLAYCNKLIFETSFKGEAIQSKITLDAKLLKKIIGDKKDKSDAAATMSIITSIEKTEEDINQHYFRVILEEVNYNDLLDELKVKEYLSMVAPVPFSSTFTYTNEIKNYFEKRNIIFDEYNVELNDKPLFKGYKNNIVDENGTDNSNIIGIDYIDIQNEEQELLAVCWFGYREKSNFVIPELNLERGIRIRTKNIAIGDEFTCQKFFGNISSEATNIKTNLRFIGEIHTVNDGFVPNARRDNFVENTTCQQFEKNARAIFTQQNLENRLAQTASKLHNRVQEILKFQSEYNKFKEQKGAFGSAASETYYLNRIKELGERALKAQKEIEKIKTKTLNSPTIKTLYQSIVKNINISVVYPGSDELQVSKYDPPKFEKLSDEQKKVVLEIFEILEEELDFNMSELIKKRIVEKYN